MHKEREREREGREVRRKGRERERKTSFEKVFGCT
jgi:hypothetical protein